MKEYLSIREVAQLLGIHINTVRKLMADGDLKFIRVTDKVIRFKYETIMEYLDKKSRR